MSLSSRSREISTSHATRMRASSPRLWLEYLFVARGRSEHSNLELACLDSVRGARAPGAAWIAPRVACPAPTFRRQINGRRVHPPSIDSERVQAFEQAYRRTAAALDASEHFEAHELSRCSDDPAQHVVCIEWDSERDTCRVSRRSARSYTTSMRCATTR